jgi:hypothetical protein
VDGEEAIIMKQSCLILLITLVFSCGTAGLTPNLGNNPVQPKKIDTPTAPSAGGVTMRVLWTVSEYKLGTNAVWGKEEADKLLFKPLDMDANSITFDGKNCRNITFKKETVKMNEYLANLSHTMPQALGIKDETAEVIKTDCNLPGFAEYIRLRDRRLVIYINGVFFFFEPTVNY